MARISDVSDDSNDAPPNQNPPQQEIQIRPKTIRDLEYDVLARILAVLRRWEYPNLSFVYREFREVIALEELYWQRRKTGNTESVLYALIKISPTLLPVWYILNKTNEESFRLSGIEYLTRRPHGAAVVTIGFYIYVFGGDVETGRTSDAFRIDCRTHKIRSLPSMSRARFRAAAGVVGGKIYVIGGCKMGDTNDWAEVYDVKKESWSALRGPYPFVIHTEDTRACVVMEGKIYVHAYYCCFTYDPRNEEWVNLGEAENNGFGSIWRPGCCVVDDVLYTFNFNRQLCTGALIVAFDPKHNFWRPVRLSIDIPVPPPPLLYYEAKMANVGGKLVILVADKSNRLENPNELTQIWCIEFTLKRRQDGGFTGTLVRAECVLTHLATRAPYIDHCLAVTV